MLVKAYRKWYIIFWKIITLVRFFFRLFIFLFFIAFFLNLFYFNFTDILGFWSMFEFYVYLYELIEFELCFYFLGYMYIFYIFFFKLNWPYPLKYFWRNLIKKQHTNKFELKDLYIFINKYKSQISIKDKLKQRKALAYIFYYKIKKIK